MSETSNFATKILPAVKLTLRETSADYDSEIKSYINSAVADLKNSGIHSSFFNDSGSTEDCDPQILQAIRFYCLSVYGLYNTDSEKYDKSYHSLKATLCTISKYTEERLYGVQQ